jgi:hypothetical protein
MVIFMLRKILPRKMARRNERPVLKLTGGRERLRRQRLLNVQQKGDIPHPFYTPPPRG